MVAKLEPELGLCSLGRPEIIDTKLFRLKDWHKRARDDLLKCTQYNMHNTCGYITAFHHTASRVVGITDDEMLNSFVAGLKLKIRE